MTHAFAKDSRACAACVSWGGERALSDDHTLVHVDRYSAEGECRTASSQDYRKVTRSYHTCGTWAPLPMLKKHGGRPERQPVFATPMQPPPSGLAAAPPAAPASASASAAAAVLTKPVPAPVVPAAPAPEPEPVVCRSDVLDIDQTPQAARVLYVYWRRVRQQRTMPLAREMDTAQLRECVPRLCLMEPVDGGADFLYRACGRAVQRKMGRRPVPLRVSACHPADAAERFNADLRACLESGQPRSLLVRDDPMLPGVRFVELLLPLAGDDGRPACVLAYRHVPGA
ncbi:PAS domain-containing protein [Azospirillum rugosum]|uniref:PAS domain-containing protein n=1 Tax=Azospirillum rugosum TaxID=416170 RepID=A0ABS4SRE4_9PROT|nr:PAS domain-containing protein [Azospirillum rugosum]MBP2295125.1 hypothetical protein [Azospirillum rugosum]MDQ0528499.1 hypothetical protein [Azospirillum rugosum]